LFSIRVIRPARSWIWRAVVPSYLLRHKSDCVLITRRALAKHTFDTEKELNKALLAAIRIHNFNYRLMPKTWDGSLYPLFRVGSG